MVTWADPELEEVTLLELRCDLDRWKVTQVLGRMKNGEEVMLEVPFTQLPRRGLQREIVRWAKRDKVYAVGLKILDNIYIHYS